MMKINKPTVAVCGIDNGKIPYRNDISVYVMENFEIAEFLETEDYDMMIVSYAVYNENKEKFLAVKDRKKIVIVGARDEETGYIKVYFVEEAKKYILALLEDIKVKAEIFSRVEEVLREFCITPNLKGKPYLSWVLCEAVSDETILNSMTKTLYVMVGKKFGSTATRAERCIRFVIKTGWDRTTPETRKKYFGNLQEIPTNSEFIATVAEHIRYEVVGFTRQ